jgi:hypothetical protein
MRLKVVLQRVASVKLCKNYLSTSLINQFCYLIYSILVNKYDGYKHFYAIIKYFQPPSPLQRVL